MTRRPTSRRPRPGRRDRGRDRARRRHARRRRPLDDPDVEEDILDADLDPAEDPDAAEAEVIAEAAAVGDDAETDGAAPAADTKLVVGKTAGVTAEDHVAEAGRKVLRFHLARMLAREPGTRMGVDLEELHGMRVATRRQRAAWRVFGDSFRRKRTTRYRNGLREIAARLGAVRDLDVLLEAADHYRKDLPVTEQRALEPLLADWRAHRDDALVLLTRELDSEDYQRWVEDYREFVRTDGRRGPAGRPGRRRIACATRRRPRIWAAYQQVRAYEPVLRWADIETLHELRIAGQVAALQPRVRPRGPRAGVGAAHRPRHRAAGPPRADARRRRGRLDGARFLVAHAGDLSTQESAAIGRYLVELRAGGHPPAADRSRCRGAASRASASGAGSDGWSRASSGPSLRPASRGPGPGAGHATPHRHAPGPGSRPRGCPPRRPASSRRRSAAGSRRR